MTDRKPRILDAFCCAGGATRGYQQAGFHVTGVDIDPQPNYCGDEFVQGDAVEFIREHGAWFDFIHTSPPCQEACTLTAGTNAGKFSYPQLIPPTRDALGAAGRPYIIENPPGKAPMRRDIQLCGEMFGLAVIRHRNFELGGWSMMQPPHVKHRGRVAGLRHGEWFQGPYFAVYGDGGGKGSVADWQAAMGIDWTDVRKEIAEAIPPAYTRYIGEALMPALSLHRERCTTCREPDPRPALLSTLCRCTHVEVLHNIRGNGTRGACSISTGAKAVPCGCKAFVAADDGGLFPAPDRSQGGAHL